MANIMATVVDAADSMMRKLGGQRLCEHCQQWSKKPFMKGGLHFCDYIHAGIYFKKKDDLMSLALEKERNGKPRNEQ